MLFLFERFFLMIYVKFMMKDFVISSLFNYFAPIKYDESTVCIVR